MPQIAINARVLGDVRLRLAVEPGSATTRLDVAEASVLQDVDVPADLGR